MLYVTDRIACSLIRIFNIALAMFWSYPVFAQTPSVAAGKVERYENFKSAFISPRTIDVWLPENYDSNKPLGVLYMHDGQMLFDSLHTWNKQEWGVDETLSALASSSSCQQTIVVGIWNTAQRRQEYFPQKVFDDLPLPLRDSIGKDIGGSPRSDAYLAFIVTELKPFIDSIYATKRDKEHTLIAGSSMGALISFYAVCEYPHVFSGAACISTHWPGSVYRNTKEVPEAFARYANRHLPLPPAKLYFDSGTIGLDSLYRYGDALIQKALAERGYTRKNYRIKLFNGADHSEKSWNKRLYAPMRYLLNP
jgi:predicted alpha/beta superfamily hydrolase